MSMADGGRASKTEKHCGFNKHWFVKKEKASEYKCYICEQILDNPQQFICCGEQFCKLCLPAEVKKCPTCDKIIKENEVFPDKSVWQKVLSLELKCPGKSCRWKGTLKDFQQEHRNKCTVVLVSCTRKDCYEQVPKDHLTKHVNDECLYRQVGCNHCSKPVTLANQKRHLENECPLIPVACPQNCQIKIPRKKIEQHKESECEMTVVACKYKNVGCNVRVTRREMANHEGTAVQDHLCLATTEIDSLNTERRNMAKEIDQLRNENNCLKKDLCNLTEGQKSRDTEIHERINKIEEEGALRLNAVQKGTEQNFDSVKKLVSQNGDFQEILLLIQNDIGNIKISGIAPLIERCAENQASIQGLKEEDDRLRKMMRFTWHRLSKADTDIKTEMNTRLEQLSQKHQDDQKEAMKIQETTTDRFLSINEAMEQNKRELGRQATALLVMKDDTSEQFRNVSKQLERDYETLAEMISKEKQSRNAHFKKLDEDVVQLKENCVCFGSSLWKIDNVEAALKMATVDPNKARYGKPFYTEPYGYLIRPKLLLNGSRQKDRSHISVFVQLLKSPHDGALQWPFRRRLRFTLVDQQQNPRLRQDIQKDLLPGPDSQELQRPTEEANNGYGIYKFVEHEVLRSGNYIVDDTIFLRVDVEPNDGNDLHSETI